MGLDSALSRDADFHDLERQELITGEPRYTEDEVRNTSISTILSVIAFLLAAIAAVLVWILYARHHNKTFLIHGIIMIIIAFFALACIAWSLGANRALKVGRQPSSLFTLVVFLLALTALGYCLVMAMWLIFFRPIHYDYLVGVFAAGKQNDRLPDGWTFDEIWRQNRRMLYWVCVFTLVCAICFGFVAYSASNAVWNKYQLIRYSLYYALAWMTLAAWIIIYWTVEAYQRAGFIQNDDAFFFIRAHKILAIVALGAALLNLIVNVVKSKVGYFIFGILMTGLFVILVCVNAGLWRQVRREQLQEINDGANVNCQTTQYSIQENDFDDFCDYLGGKYLAAGDTCGKSNLVTRWESGNAVTNPEIRSLNPACCLLSKHVNIWPFMNLAFWGLVLLLSTALAMICNFYLADTTEYLTNANKVLGIGDYIGIAVILLLSIAWGIYFIARKATSSNDQMFSRGNYINSYNNPTDNPVSGWPLIPPALLATSNPASNAQSATGSICFPYDTSVLPFPAFQNVNANCANPNTCSIRLALSVLNGARFQVGNIGTANRAFSDNRFVFFPQCAAVMSDFVMFYGTQEQIRAVLSNLFICPSSAFSDPTIQVYTDQVTTSGIANSGLVAGEVSGSAAVNSNTAQCGAGFTANSCSTSATCRFRSTLISQRLLRTLKGRFYYISNGQKRYDVPASVNVAIQGFTVPAGQQTLQFINGIFSIPSVPVYLSRPYRLRLVISDSSNTFLSSLQDVVIDPKFGTDQISAGEIRLNTIDGNVCLPFGNNAACLSTQPTSRGSITSIVQDGGATVASTSNSRIGGADVRVIQKHVVDGNNVAQLNTDNNGVVTFNNLVFDAYTLIATKTGYNPSVQFIDLQSPTVNPKPFTLIPTVTDFDAKIIAEMLTPATDYDLILQMRNFNSQDCEVSPYNKYCPYSFYINDITTGPGEESIVIKRLSVATYNAFVRQSPPYNINCPGTDSVRQRAYHLAANFNWKHLQGSGQVKILPGTINPRTLFASNSLGLSFDDLLISSLGTSAIVETTAEAQLLKTVIEANGTALDLNQQFQASSYFVNSDKSQNGTQFNIPAPAATILYLTCTAPPAGASNCLNGTASVINLPATTAVSVLNYSLINGNLQSTISNQTNITTYNNNQSVLTSILILNNTKNTTDNTIVNGTFTNITIADPTAGFNNQTNATSINVTTYANGSVVTQTRTDFFINNTLQSNTSFNRYSEVVGNVNGINSTLENINNQTLNTTFAYDQFVGLNRLVNSSILNNTNIPSTLFGNISAINNTFIFSSLTANNTSIRNGAINANFTNGLKINFSENLTISYLDNISQTNYAKHNESRSNYSTFSIYDDSFNTTVNNFTGLNISARNQTFNVTYFNNSTEYIATNISTGNFTTTTIAISNSSNISVISNNTSNSTTVPYFNITSNNTTAVTSFNGSLEAANSTALILQRIDNWTAVLNVSTNYVFAFNGPFTWCNVSNNTLYQVRNNATVLQLRTLSYFCQYQNGSQLNNTTTSYSENSTVGGAPFYRNNSVVNYTVIYTNNGTSQSFVVAPARRLLAQAVEEQLPLVKSHLAEAHQQGGAVTSASVTGGSFLWISCFTGYGNVSAIYINNLQDNQPTLSDCIGRITSERPNYTVQKLNDAVNSFRA